MSKIIDLSHQQSLMDIDYQSVNVSKDENVMELYDGQSIPGTLNFIKSNGSIDETNPDRESELNDFTQNLKGGKEILHSIIAKFMDAKKVYLHFIAFEEGIYALNLNGDKQAVFYSDDMCAKNQVNKYIEKLNRTDPRQIPRIQENIVSTIETDSVYDMKIDDVSALASGHTAELFDSSEDSMDIGFVRHQTIQIDNTTFPDGSISLSIRSTGDLSIVNQVNIISSSENDNHHVQSNASEHVGAIDQIPISGQLYTSNDYPNTIQVSNATATAPSTRILYEKPTILIQPKTEWKCRYPKDLIANRKKKSKKPTKYIGLLQGAGSQRSRIKVQVPEQENRTNYLAITVRTINNRKHDLKVIVPEKTKVNKDRFNKENQLNYLEFDECNSLDEFDPNNRIVYMKITAKEHQQKFKEVPIYMFNLYQTARLTKDMIKNEQLDKCCLAFWFCVKQENNYIPISEKSLSYVITEKKEKTTKINPP